MPGILGIITARQSADDGESQLRRMLRSMLHESFYTYGTYALAEHGCYLGWVTHPNSFSDCNPIVNASGDRILIFVGEHFEHGDSTANAKRLDGRDASTARYLLNLYEETGTAILPRLNGWFAGVLVDLRNRTTLLFNDRFGLHRVYYLEDRGSFAFSSEAKALLSIRPEARRIDARALGEFVAFGSVFKNRTLFPNVFVLPGGSAWTFGGPTDINKRQYFDPATWEQQPLLDDEAFYTSLKTTFSRILPTYFRSHESVGISLTGGLDTRLIMAARPPLAEPPACYTYGGFYRDCFDVQAARDVATACDLRHHLIALDPDFFADFPTLAEQTVWLTDGSLDICGSHEVYFSRRARQVSPVRLTGNYGSEILRSLSTFKGTPLAAGLFDAALAPYLEEAKTSFAEINATHRVSLAAFKEIPWNLYGRLAAAESQLIVRSPFIDNELVALMYRASPQLRATNRLTLRLLSELSPSLFKITTDMGYGGEDPRPVALLRRVYRYLLFKAEWYYNAGMPHWIARLDHNLFMRHLEPLFVGSHKIEHYRLWFRDQLFDYVQSMLCDRVTAARSYLNRKGYRELVASHREGSRNCMNEINRLLTLELIQRTLIEADYGTRGPNELLGTRFSR
jgi:asparagine synthase (glutamine-hydrolysing)